MAELTSRQKDIIVRTVLGEAANQGQAGMQAVASVIRNRSLSGQFSSDPAVVAQQHNGPWYQFTANADTNHSGNSVGKNAKSSSAAYQRAAAAVDSIFNDEVPDPTGGALYYHTADTTAPWDRTMSRTAQIGQHVFYSPSPAPPSNVPSVLSAYANTDDPNSALSAINAAAPPLPIPRPSAADRTMTGDFNSIIPVPLASRAKVGSSAADSLATNPTVLPFGADLANGAMSWAGLPTYSGPSFSDVTPDAADQAYRLNSILPQALAAAGGFSGAQASASGAQSPFPTPPPLPVPRPVGGPFNELDAAATSSPQANSASWANLLGNPTSSILPSTTVTNSASGQSSAVPMAGSAQLPANVNFSSIIPQSSANPFAGSNASASGNSGQSNWADPYYSTSGAAGSGASSVAMNDPGYGLGASSRTGGADLSSLDLPSSVNVPKYITVSKQVQVPYSVPIETGSGVHWDATQGNYVLDSSSAPQTATKYKTVTQQVQELNPAYTTPPLASSPINGMTAANPLSDWFGSTPLGHITSALTGGTQSPTWQHAGLLGSLLGGAPSVFGSLMGALNGGGNPSVANSPTPQPVNNVASLIGMGLSPAQAQTYVSGGAAQQAANPVPIIAALTGALNPQSGSIAAPSGGKQISPVHST